MHTCIVVDSLVVVVVAGDRSILLFIVEYDMMWPLTVLTMVKRFAPLHEGVNNSSLIGVLRSKLGASI